MRAAPVPRAARYDQIADLARKLGPVTIAEVCHFAGLDVRYATRLVNEMTASGTLRRAGTAPRETVRGRKPYLFEVAP